ncbi:MAG: peptidase [Gemmatimonadetes bacterium]|nr:peptidase [Gemmatimonadota bacterium]
MSAAGHLHVLGARSRGAGTASLEQARAYCTEVLSRTGCAVTARPFQYSGFPGRFATPIAGLGAWLTTLGAGEFGIAMHPARALLVLTVGIVAIALFARWASREGVLHSRWLRASGVNLEATRTPEPLVWLVAHLDSKSQLVPILARVSGIVATSVLLALELLMASAAMLGVAVPEGAWLATIFLSLPVALPVILTLVGDRSPGAVDNASGVAALLAAAEQLGGEPRVGFLVSDGEELGLAGARAWVQGRRPGIALNCDTIDDQGPYVWMGGRRSAERIFVAARAASVAGTTVRTRALLPGILTDAVALEQAGWQAATLSRGTLRTLARIHGARDGLVALRGEGLDSAAALLVQAARAML